jgi:hypothetical protein
MGCILKRFALIMVLMTITSLSLIMIKPAFAQSLPTPSIPDYTLKYVNSSYSINTTDPYTGTAVTNKYINNTIEIAIKNQPFNPQVNSSVTLHDNLYYNISVKGHFSDEWTYPLSTGFLAFFITF